MRARTIKPGFFSNEDLCALPHATRLLFAGLWSRADRAGRLEDRPVRIRADIFPYEPDLDVDPMLEELDDSELIFRYVFAGIPYIQIPKWGSHQRPHPHEVDSVIPPIPCNLIDFAACRDMARQSRGKTAGSVRLTRNIDKSSELSSNSVASGRRVKIGSKYSYVTDSKVSRDMQLHVMTCQSGSSGSSGSSKEPPFDSPTGELLLTAPNGNEKRKRGKGKPVTMSGHSRTEMGNVLGMHPKNTIQVVSFRNLWADKVGDDQILIDWLKEQLRRECAGDTTYMLGPGKWLAAHLELYAAGVQPATEKPRNSMEGITI